MSELRSGILKIYAASRNSWGGRGLFVCHLLFMIVIFKQHESILFATPVLAFLLTDLPQFVILRFVAAPFAPTPFNLALMGLFISIPWWAYGVAAEFAVRRFIERKAGT